MARAGSCAYYDLAGPVHLSGRDVTSSASVSAVAEPNLDLVG